MRRSGFLLALVLACAPGKEPPPRAVLSITGALGGGESAGFERVLAPRPFHFPTDHGPHPGFRNEWWYWTGNLESDDGRHFGYQLTFFRTALLPHVPERSSKWATDTVYMAHLTVTDVQARRFHAFDRFSRAALGLAGASADPFHVWLGDWRAERLPTQTLTALDQGVGLSLTLEPGKPIVLQGNQGLSQKGPEPGNASSYYSQPRMPTRGTLTLSGQRIAVHGDSWMDREWGTSQLSSAQVGWDWFSLQLSDGSELMYYQLRERDGAADAFSHGTLVAPDGSATPLSAQDVRVTAKGSWTSPHSGAVYPSGWTVTVPRLGETLEVTPYLPDQELNLAVRYWEGASHVEGVREGRPLKGVGYVELTGYEAP